MKTFKNDNKRIKKKALQATWDGSDSSSDEESSSDGEKANMCFIAQEDELSPNNEEIDTEELLEALNELYTKYKTLKSKSTQHINHLTK